MGPYPAEKNGPVEEDGPVLKQSDPENIFFDLDGTLTDSSEGIIKCIQHTLTNLGLPSPPEDDLIRWIGPPLQDTFAKTMGTTEQKDIDRAMSFYRERYVEIGIYENKIYDGIFPLLTQLVDKGFTLYVVTSKPWVYAGEVIKSIELKPYFKSVYGSELDGGRTNKADLIGHVLKEEGISPEDTIMIGDREYDILGAKANRVDGIGVSWGYGSIEELESAGAIGICHIPEMLISMLCQECDEV